MCASTCARTCTCACTRMQPPIHTKRHGAGGLPRGQTPPPTAAMRTGPPRHPRSQIPGIQGDRASRFRGHPRGTSPASPGTPPAPPPTPGHPQPGPPDPAGRRGRCPGCCSGAAHRGPGLGVGTRGGRTREGEGRGHDTVGTCWGHGGGGPAEDPRAALRGVGQGGPVGGLWG